MISISEMKASSKESNYYIGEIRGLSTDEKPTETVSGKTISNGCVFIELDTSKIYFYDAENKEWLEFGGSSSSSSSES